MGVAGERGHGESGASGIPDSPAAAAGLARVGQNINIPHTRPPARPPAHQVDQHRQRHQQVHEVQLAGAEVPQRGAGQRRGEDLAAPHLAVSERRCGGQAVGAWVSTHVDRRPVDRRPAP